MSAEAAPGHTDSRRPQRRHLDARRGLELSVYKYFETERLLASMSEVASLRPS